MTKQNLHHTKYSKDHNALLEAINVLVLKHGPKATTMDLVAQELKMSKRTLYEIFESKNDMIQQALDYNARTFRNELVNITRTSENVMEALARILHLNRERLKMVSPMFFKDMDRLYPAMRKDHDARYVKHRETLIRSFHLGVRQGVFRSDVNYEITARLLEIQGEALKRMENNFPDGVSILEVYDTMVTSMIRSIASPKGLEWLDSHPMILQ